MMGCTSFKGIDSGPVNKLLFQAPDASSYGIWSFKEELLWVPLVHYGTTFDVGNSINDEEVSDYVVPCRLFKRPGARTVVMYCHRNAEDLGTCKRFCEKLRDSAGVHVFVPEYPGYGICMERKPNSFQATRHAFAALDFLQRALAWPLEQVVVFGYCVGAGPAMMLASQAAVGGLVLISPYLSLKDLFRNHVGSALSHLITEQLPIEQSVPRIGCRTLIFHGKLDKMVPVSHSEKICASLKVENKLVSPPESGHNASLIQDDALLLEPMRDFFGLPGEAVEDLEIPSWAFSKNQPPPTKTAISPYHIDGSGCCDDRPQSGKHVNSMSDGLHLGS